MTNNDLAEYFPGTQGQSPESRNRTSHSELDGHWI